MRRSLVVLAIAAGFVAIPVAAQTRLPRDLDNVAAFARLYGVVRYFYPSDAAASLAWNRFAVHGARLVRAARTTADLETSLKTLFAPLGPGIDIGRTLAPVPAPGTPDKTLIAWRYLGAGMDAATQGVRGPYKRKRTNRGIQMPPGVNSSVVWGVPGPPTTAEVFDADPPAPGAHVDVDLGAGLTARVRLALTDAEARGDAKASASVEALKRALEAIGDSPEQPDIDTRAADVVVAWNVFRHFYPYWAEAGVDWNTRLRPQLEIAAAAKSRDAQRDALRRLVADARDGHGGVSDRRHRAAMGWLPVALEMREARVVIVASRAPNDAPVGAVVTTIDGVPASTRLADLIELSSGTSQWRERRALYEISSCQLGTPVTLALETSAGARTSTLACDAKTPALENRPDPVSELSAGVWYVDLSRARMTDITPMLPKLAAGKGVVFDLRGYPTDAGASILAHLLDSSEKDRWMHVARLTGPFGQNAGWESEGWNQTPQPPHFRGRIVFLTDSRAISYAESVMGYVRDRKLATIVGATTAGTNGNVVSFDVPSGFVIGFTGMKVTRHDGRSAFHLIGVEPDIPVAPTIAGLRSGRDEVLERGLSVIDGKQP